MAKYKENQIVGIQVRHYRNQFDWPEAPEQTKDFGETVTDTSTYKPDISLVRAFLGSGGASKKQFLYDYPAGTPDDGETIRTVLRSAGLDITEVDTAERVITQIIEEKRKSDKLTAEQKKSQQDIIDAIKDAKDSVQKGSESQDSSNSEQNSSK